MRSHSDAPVVWWARIGAPCAISAAIREDEDDAAHAAAEPGGQGSTAAGDIAGLHVAAPTRGGTDQPQAGRIGSIGRSGWRCGGASANGSPSHRVARRSRRWKRGEAWSMDFMQDVLIDGRRFRTLNILDLRDTRVLGDGGRHLVARPARDARARPARRLLWRAQADHGRQWPRVCWARPGRLGVRARRDAWISSSLANPRRTPTSRASTASFAMSAWICTGSAVSPMPEPSSRPGRRSTTPSDPIAPCAADPSGLCPVISNLAVSLIIPGHHEGLIRAFGEPGVG